MSEVAAKLPLLSKESLEAVGRCCPLLKSIKWNQQWYTAYGLSQIKCNEEAVAIAKNMPELCHLQIIGNKLMNDGLLAILDGNLGKYAERIKVLRHPDDSTDNYEFVADDGSFGEGSDIVCSLDSTYGDEVVDDIHDDESFDDDDDSGYDPTNSY
ncbi:putative F-box protein At4g05475 [Quercus lobata]|uniref:putative F-box protein At4g05475 n=1 Tax=Quercus lobata TaxID=97700 RepID=UPI001243ECEB|nr:putative F-box protein At4g05475 [Quercus lobata]